MSVWDRLFKVLSRYWFGPACIALMTAVLVSVMLDPAGDYPQGLAGPGLTLDEIFNVQIGVAMADPLLSGDLPKLIQAGRLLPDHPPLGRLWLGIAHEVNLLIHPPVGKHDRIVIACARTGSAVAFGLLVFLTGYVSALWNGRLAGVGTSLAIVFMPRVFGHAHLAALESVLNLTYTAAFLSLACWWKPDFTANAATPSAPRIRAAILCGLVFGLALLTKIQAIFIPIPVVIWAVVNWRWRALWPLAIWGCVGLLIFFAGWPWLWADPWGHLLKYLGHAKERPVIYVWYFGRQIADRNVPWHYPWVLFATTVPLGLHLMGLGGLAQMRPRMRAVDAKHDQRLTWSWLGSREVLIAGGMLLPLVVFSLPGIAAYDGERLFLMIFPLWAIFIGQGMAAAMDWVSQRTNPTVSGITLAGFLACQSVGLIQYSPVWLSYYNILVGGLEGAEKLGLQTTYWGDSITRELLVDVANQAPAGSLIDVLPVQHPFQLAALESQCPPLRDRQIKLRAFDEREKKPAKYLLVFQRRDYWPAEWNGTPQPYRLVLKTARQNTTLAAFYERLP